MLAFTDWNHRQLRYTVAIVLLITMDDRAALMLLGLVQGDTEVFDEDWNDQFFRVRTVVQLGYHTYPQYINYKNYRNYYYYYYYYYTAVFKKNRWEEGI